MFNASAYDRSSILCREELMVYVRELRDVFYTQTNNFPS